MKQQKEGWFQQMINPMHCPALLGSFETGAHTHEGNNIILYMETTRKFNERATSICVATWKGLSRKNSASMGKSLFPKEGIPDTSTFAILSAGITVPTLVGCYTYNMVKRLYEEMLKEYEIEMGEKPETTESTFKDLHNYIMRKLNDWMNENKRVPHDLYFDDNYDYKKYFAAKN